MKKIKLKKIKSKKINIVITIIILIIISIIFIFNYIGKHITPIIINYAEKQAKKIALVVMSKAIDDEIINGIDPNNLFITNNNDTNYNMSNITELLKKISINVKSYLKKLETGEISNLGLTEEYTNVSTKKLKNGIIYEVPTGIIFNNGMLANLGPKIPIKLSLVGDITTDIITDIKEYGINNALISLSVNVKVTEQLILPFSYKQIVVENNFPLTIKLIEGNVPSYYLNPYTLSTN